jgi:hypothetical protein
MLSPLLHHMKYKKAEDEKCRATGFVISAKFAEFDQWCHINYTFIAMLDHALAMLTI